MEDKGMNLRASAAVGGHKFATLSLLLSPVRTGLAKTSAVSSHI